MATRSKRGRPPVKPAKLKDGFYIEVRNRGAASGVKIHNEDKASMERAAEMYRRTKEVIVMGEAKDGKWVS